MMKLLNLSITIFLLSSCGIKGPPLPPLKEETIQSQKNWDEAEKSNQSADQRAEEKKPVLKKKTATSGN